ncbi:MAG: hypothetical protein HYZ73_06930, partial [Elusimicrobia bacterium]|nr:hypothetical protein [Elusimicrobiota bacterium]
MALVYVYASIIAPPLLQASFWESRRIALRHQRQNPREVLETTVRHGLPAETPHWVVETAAAIAPLGVIRSVHLPTPHPTRLVLLIQDAHGLPEVQHRLANLLQWWAGHHRLRLIGLEGSSSRFDLEPFRQFPSPRILQDVARHLTDLGLLSGPELAGLTTSQALTLQGVEQPASYEQHVRLFKRLIALQAQSRTDIAAASNQLQRWRSRSSSHANPAEPAQQFFNELVSDLALLEKLVALRLTPAEWDLYQTRRPFLSQWPQRLASLTQQWPLKSDETLLERSLPLFEQFYEAAVHRNRWMTARLLQAMRDEQQPLAALVAGGFHTPGLERELKRCGVGFLTVTPLVSHVPERY